MVVGTRDDMGMDCIEHSIRQTSGRRWVFHADDGGSQYVSGPHSTKSISNALDCALDQWTHPWLFEQRVSQHTALSPDVML